MKTIDRETLMKYHHYDPDTGVFTRLTSSGGIFPGGISGSLHDTGYIQIKINRILYKAHRLAFLYMTGSMPEFVDHINGVRDDNRWCNLRACSLSQNAWNRKINRGSPSGVKGVGWHKASGKWRARFSVGGKKYHLGLWDNKEDAESALRTERDRHHKEFSNHGN